MCSHCHCIGENEVHKEGFVHDSDAFNKSYTNISSYEESY